MTRIAIIGAGATGLAAARLLAARGHTVELFDKGRRAGGRLAARESEYGSFDHGVQFVRLSDSEVAAHGTGLLQAWRDLMRQYRWLFEIGAANRDRGFAPMRLAEFMRGVPGLGVILVALVIFSTGVFVANMFGQWWLRKWHGLMNRIPVVRSIYTSVKQVADTLFSGSGNAFSKALLVQYPRQGSWTIAFLTGTPGGEVAKHLEQPMVSVYVPTTPNPTSGFFLMMPKADVIELDMSVDDALKYIISMGVVVPGTTPH